MEVKYFGHSCFQLKGKTACLVFDPFDPAMVGLPLKGLAADIVTVSHDHGDHSFTAAVLGNPYIVRGVGEYEIKEVKIKGVASFHDDSAGSKRGRNTVYNVVMDGIGFCHLGDLGHKLEDSQLKELDAIDVLFVPIGGFFTIDPKAAVEVIAQIEPKIVVPMHFRVPQLKPGLSQLSSLEDFLREFGETPRREKTLKITRENLLSEETSLVVLENSRLP